MKENYKSVYKNERAREELLITYDKILRNWPIAYNEINVVSKYGKTHIINCGNRLGESVVLFHGTGNNSLMWRYNCEELGKNYNLYLIDTINDPGKSEATYEFNPNTDYGNWIRTVIEQLALDKFSIIGHSKGGWIALNTLLCLSERIKRCILLAPAVGINEKLDNKFLFKSLKLGFNPSIKNVKAYFEYISPPGKELNNSYLEYLAMLIKGTISKPIKHRKFTDEELKSIKMPIYLLFGEYEKCNDYKSVIHRAELFIANITSEVINNAGHGLQGDQPEIVNDKIIRFLKN